MCFFSCFAFVSCFFVFWFLLDGEQKSEREEDRARERVRAREGESERKRDTQGDREFKK